MTHGRGEAVSEGTPFGRYRLQRRLGRGGMGEVWVAWDTHKECEVALKRLRHEYAEDADFQMRFRREAQLAARLRDPHVIPIHDFGEIDGHLYIEMRLVDGSDLEQTIRATPLSTTQVIDVLTQVAAALDAAHATGLVHRDVKPSNIVLTGRPERYFAYLVDFGIARPLVGHGGSKVTATVGTVGTLTYLAPERIEGEPGDRRADVYSLACVLYECLTGSAPFAGEQFAVMYAHVNKPAPKATDRQPALPPAVDDVIARGMAKAPEDRYDSAGDLVDAARDALTAAPMATADATTLLPSSPFTPPPASFTPPPFMPLPSKPEPPPQTEPPAPPRSRRRRFDVRAAALAGVGALGVLLAFLKFSWFRRGNAGLDSLELTGSHSTFAKLHKSLNDESNRDSSLYGHLHFGISQEYFGWLGWTLFTVVAVLAGAVLVRPDRWLRVVAVAVAGLAFVGTIFGAWLFRFDDYAVDYAGYDPPGIVGFVKLGGFGLWAALVGFVLLALASILRRGRENSAAADTAEV